jgi:C4-dicarboxylate transporter DctM subunit
LFGFLLTREQLPVMATNAITELATSTGMFCFLIVVMLLIVGTFMEVAPAVLLLSPILIPMLKGYGLHPVSFGVSMIITLGIGLVTPPVGLNLYATANIAGVAFEKVVNKHLFCYMLCALVILAILFCFPQIIMLLPNSMY